MSETRESDDSDVSSANCGDNEASYNGGSSDEDFVGQMRPSEMLDFIRIVLHKKQNEAKQNRMSPPAFENQEYSEEERDSTADLARICPSEKNYNYARDIHKHRYHCGRKKQKGSSRTSVHKTQSSSRSCTSHSDSHNILPKIPIYTTMSMYSKAMDRGNFWQENPTTPERKPVAFTTPGLQVVTSIFDPVYEESSDTSGCSILDIHFSVPTNVAEIAFRNFYTADIGVMIRAVRYGAQSTNLNETECIKSTGYEGKGDAEDLESWPWESSIERKILMPNPHIENGAQDIFIIQKSESSIPWKNILAMKFILRQPSPVFVQHSISNLNVFTEHSTSEKSGKLFISDASEQVYQNSWKLMQLNTINSLTPQAYRPYSINEYEAVPDYEIYTL